MPGLHLHIANKNHKKIKKQRATNSDSAYPYNQYPLFLFVFKWIKSIPFLPLLMLRSSSFWLWSLNVRSTLLSSTFPSQLSIHIQSRFNPINLVLFLLHGIKKIYHLRLVIFVFYKLHYYCAMMVSKYVIFVSFSFGVSSTHYNILTWYTFLLRLYGLCVNDNLLNCNRLGTRV